MQGRFPELDRTYVILGNANLFIAFVQYIGIGASFQHYAITVLALNWANDAVLIDNASQEHFRDDFDNPGTADSADPDLNAFLREFRVIRPDLAADHAKSRFQGLWIDAYAFHRARCCTLARGNLRAFKRGAGRARGG